MNLQDIPVALCMDILDPHAAEFARNALTLTPRFGTEEVAVEWGPFGTPRQFPMLKEFLRYFCWPTNGEQPDTAKSYIEASDPNQASFTVKGQDFFGRWRLAFVTERKQELRVGGEAQYFIGVTLRFGWATAVNEDEWRVESATGDTTTGNYKLQRYHPNISNTHLEALSRARTATTSLTAPKVEGQALTGITFAVSGVKGDRADDGSGILHETLTQVSAPTDLSGFQALTVRAGEYNQEITELFGLFASGEREGLVLIWNNLADTAAVRKLCTVTITDAQLLAIPNSASSGIPDNTYGWTYASRKWQGATVNPAGDGTARLICVVSKVTRGKTWAADKKALSASNPSGTDAGYEEVVQGQTAAQAVSDYATIAAPTNYTLEAKRILQLAEDQFGVAGQYKRTYPEVTAESALVGDIQVAVGNSPARCSRIWYRRDATAKTTLAAAGSIARLAFTVDTVTYAHYSMEVIDHHDGAFSVVQHGIIASWTWEWDGATEVENSPLYAYRYEFADINGVHSKRMVKTTYSVDFKGNAHVAYDYIDGGLDGSSVSSHGPHKWKAIKVTAITRGSNAAGNAYNDNLWTADANGGGALP